MNQSINGDVDNIINLNTDIEINESKYFDTKTDIDDDGGDVINIDKGIDGDIRC